MEEEEGEEEEGEEEEERTAAGNIRTTYTKMRDAVAISLLFACH